MKCKVIATAVIPVCLVILNGLILPLQGRDIPASIAPEVHTYLLERLGWRPVETNKEALARLLPDIGVYELWVEKSGSSSQDTMGFLARNLGIYLFYQPGTGKLLNISENPKEKLFAIADLSGITLDSRRQVERLFRTIDSVEEVIEKGNNRYWVFTGETFFDYRSGYEADIDSDGRLTHVVRKLKLAPKQPGGTNPDRSDDRPGNSS